eukprot:jgi/Botrbrau1/13790/Bobra.0056s0040.1
MFLVASAIEKATPGLLASLPEADVSMLAAGAIVFGAQRLIPNYTESYKEWYPKLVKPKWNPPNWVFPTVWIPLKVLQSAALWLVWKTGTAPGADRSILVAPLTVFGVHMFLGNWWNVVLLREEAAEAQSQVDGSLLGLCCWLHSRICYSQQGGGCISGPHTAVGQCGSQAQLRHCAAECPEVRLKHTNVP